MANLQSHYNTNKCSRTISSWVNFAELVICRQQPFVGSVVNLTSNHENFAKDWYGMYVREVLGDTSGGSQR